MIFAGDYRRLVDSRYTYAVIIALAVYFVTATDSRSYEITKRSLSDLCNIIELYTERPCIDYNQYGCFCGFGSKGNTPIDDVDKCCYDHDECYGQVNCSFFAHFLMRSIQSYNYKCQVNDTNCACFDNNVCSRQYCECDLELAKCLNRYNYTDELKGYDRKLCF